MDPSAKEIANVAEIMASSKEDVPLEVWSSASGDFFPTDPVFSVFRCLFKDVGVFFFVIIVECKGVLDVGR